MFRRGWLILFGPVFFHELLRGSRRRPHLIRSFYATLLLIALVYAWVIVLDNGPRRLGAPDEQARIAEAFVALVLVIQLGVVVLFTPGAVGGAIAEEKERKTLEFLLATDLSGHEIALGRLFGRIADIFFLLIASVPIVAMLQLVGGVSPVIIVAAYAATGCVLLGVVGVCTYFSARCRRARDAIVLSYVFVLAFVLITTLVSEGIGKVITGPVTIAGTIWTEQDIANVLCAGNPIVARRPIAEALDALNPLDDVVWPFVGRAAIFHGVVFLLTVGFTAFRLRHIAISQMERRGQAVTRTGGKPIPDHPEVGNFPMLWKEVFIEPGRRSRWWVRAGAWIIAIASFMPAVWYTCDHGLRLIVSPPDGRQYYRGFQSAWDKMWSEYANDMNEWVRYASAIVGTLALLSVAARAAGSVSGERDRGTMDELLTTRLYAREIVLSKWFGCLLGTRGLWRWVAILIFVGLVSGGIGIPGVMVTTAYWLTYSSFFASLGLYLSVRASTSARATMSTLALATFFAGGHWLICPMCCFGLGGSLDFCYNLSLGLTPPIVLYGTPLQSFEELERVNTGDEGVIFIAFFSIIFYLVASTFLLSRAIVRFSRQSNRDVELKPRVPPKLERLDQKGWGNFPDAHE
jgi:ABC-type transport system involved in multi-copper enzyme maturation permease subunit